METTHFKLENELTFKTVVGVRAQLHQALMSDRSGHFCLDLSAVTHCDSAGLALLIESMRLCKQRNTQFEMIGSSSETQSLAEFCGVKGLLETV